VWKATSQLGLAAAISPSQKVIFVARYKARGNFGNKQAYIDNVKPKGKLHRKKLHKIRLLLNMSQELHVKYHNYNNTYKTIPEC
jgi:hypothetical protein